MNRLLKFQRNQGKTVQQQAIGARLVITDQDRAGGMSIINAVISKEEWTQAEFGNAVVNIFKSGMFRGATAMGAIIVEDISRPTTFTAKLKALFRKG